MSGNSPFDRFIEGDRKAMSEAAVRGYQLYLSKANCASCHVSFNFSDETYHNLGVGMLVRKPMSDALRRANWKAIKGRSKRRRCARSPIRLRI